MVDLNRRSSKIALLLRDNQKVKNEEADQDEWASLNEGIFRGFEWNL